jgi:ATP-dependent Clp protease ATP-binding subunit ClpB
VLDDGRLTDGQGNVVDFKNTVIILTSNLGSELAVEIEQRRDVSEQHKRELIETAVREAARRRFRPELLNRLDEKIVFHRLEREQLSAIVEIQLGRFLKRLLARGIRAVLSDAAKQVLIREGWDPQYGARPLKRAIQRLVENEFARRILAGEIKDGDVVHIGASDGGLKFEKQTLN